MSEDWMPVPDWNDLYEISSAGRLRRNNRNLRPHLDAKGYVRFRLSRNGKISDLSAHRLMWTAFRGPIPVGMQINHRDGNRSGNTLSNLELCSPSENVRHAFSVLGRTSGGVRNSGAKNGMAKLSDADVSEMRRLRSNGAKHREIADQFGLTVSWVGKILRKSAWMEAVRA